MSYKSLASLTFLLLICFYSAAIAQNRGIKNKKTQEKLFSKNIFNDYEVFWRQIDSLDENKMTQSAKKIAEDIYQMALSEKNDRQILKALIVKLSYEKALDKKNENLVIKEMNSTLSLLKFPERNILSSTLAGEYYQYYYNNFSDLRSRHEIPNDSSSEFESWSLRKINEEAEKLFFLSLERSEELKQIPASEYSDFIVKGNYYGHELRPTLFDMLCHYALNCFRSSHYYILGNSITNEAGLWGTAEEFLSTVNAQKDSSFAKNKIVRILKELTLFHVKDISKSELADIDLVRLNFLRENSWGGSKDSLYLNALNKMLDYYKGCLPSSRIMAQLASFYKELPNNLYRSEDFRWARKKALLLCDSAIVNFPNSFGAKESESVKSEILRQFFSLNAEKAVLPGEPFRALVRCQNVNKVYFRIIEEALIRSDAINWDGPALINFFRSIRPLKTFEQTLPDPGDYYWHKYDVFFPPLPLGRYIILASTDSNFSDSSGLTFYQGICATYLSAIIKNEGEYTKLYVLDRKSGQPLKDVTVERLNGRETIRLKTDKNGLADLPLDFHNRDLILSKENDAFMIEDNSVRQKESNYGEGYSGETVFFFDRGIYRPGQTLFFKGISMLHRKSTGEYETWKDRELTVTLNDASGRMVSKLELETNDFGTFSGQFDLPENVLPGRWSVQEGFSSEYFHLEEYKRPQFEVLIDKIKGEYSSNDEIKVTGSVQAYSGALLSHSKVKFSITRTPAFYYGNRRYLQSFTVASSSLIASGSVTAGENGDFEFSFRAIPDPREKFGMKVYRYSIEVDVTDMTGESHRAETSMMAGDVSILADINVPQVVTKGEKQNYNITTAGLNGNFQPAEIHLSVYKLKMPDRIFRHSLLEKPDTNLVSRDEFYRTFSHDEYLDEHNFTSWEKEQLVLDTVFVTVENQTFGSNIFSSLKQGKYILIFSAKDKSGKPAEMIRYFTLLDPMAKNIPLNEALWFHPLKTVAHPGEDLEVSIGTALSSMNVLFEIESRGKTAERKWLNLSCGQRVVKIPIEEDYRGYIDLHCLAIWNNSVYSFTERVNVPWSNKKLKLELETFRNKITPGETETRKIRVKDESGRPVEAEVLAAMYDQSLDGLGYKYKWGFNIFNDDYFTFWWNAQGSFSFGNSRMISRNNQNSQEMPKIWHNELYYFGLGNIYHDGGLSKYKSRKYEESYQLKMSPFWNWLSIWGSMSYMKKDNTNAVREIKEEAFTFIEPKKDIVVSLQSGLLIRGTDFTPDLSFPEEKNKLIGITARKNLSETAFFYPHLLTDDKGTAEFSFKAPEALTKWKFMAFAHTEDLASGMLTASAVTQKKLMVQAFPPRFFRENDTIWYTARVSNLSDSTLTGHVQLMSFDAKAMKPVDEFLGNENSLQEVRLEPKETKAFKWKLIIPEGKFNSISCRVSAICGDNSDGEESLIPVLGNRTLITESMPLPVLGKENRFFTFENLKNNTSSSLKNHRLTLEFTSNPAYLALRALPSLLGYSFGSADNIFNSYYAASIAMHIANSHPGFKEVVDSWKDSGKEKLSSNLQKNQELKNILLEETPWYGEAQSEEENKARLGELFDFAKLQPQLAKAEDLLRSMQTDKGGWPWFPGLEANICLTQSIIAGFGHLEKLGISAVTPRTVMENTLLKAIHWCDEKMYRDYVEAKKKDSTLTGVYLDNEKVQYLYARSFFTKYPLYSIFQEAFNFWKKQALGKWQGMGLYMQGMTALMCQRYNDKTSAEKIMRSVLDNAITDNEMGMYFQQENGYYWYQAPIETQALLIEAVDEILHDRQSVDKMKVWLLKNKQTHSWKSTRATSEAVYALLLRGTDWTEESQPAEIQIGDEKLDLVKNNPEAGTGYVKMSWDAEKIRPEMSNVMITNRNSAPAWGALYWQYFEKLDNIAQANSSLSIHKELLLKTGINKAVRVTDTTRLKAGDELKVRLIIKTDRDMEFVHIKDMRASGLEPVNVLSGSRYQEGFYYYEATKDASTNFFIDRLPKGTYVFEYPLKVTYNGTFSDGIAEIQCLYAPEYRSHSAETHLRVQ
ncbi:MAG TPA: alpha-2-macroglobulin family protein [Ignavibacteriales bacterium]|nr:alpha-2-macroglobulin family protein [Ignavibacteriales bacterium]